MEVDAQVAGVRPVLLATEADRVRLDHIVFAALDTIRKENEDAGNGDRTAEPLQQQTVCFYDNDIGSYLDTDSWYLVKEERIAELLTRCTEVAPRDTEATVAPPPDDPLETRQFATLQAQVAELQERVSQLRTECPRHLAASMDMYLQNSRHLLELGPAPSLEAAETAAPLRPAPADLQASLADAMSKAPVLRARLSETLARLERVVAALDAGKENMGSDTQTGFLGSQKAGNLGTEEAKAAQGLLFQKQVADSILGSRQL